MVRLRACRESLASTDVEGALKRALFAVDLLLQLQNGIEQRFGTRRASGNVNVHRNDLIAALNDGVVIENAARCCASAHGNHPLWFGHLLVKLADNGRHLLRETSGHNHQVCLTRRGTKYFRAKSRHVKTRRGHGHHFNGAAGQAESEGPDRAPTRPIHGFIERGENNAFVFEQLAEIVWLGQCDVFAERYAHRNLNSILAYGAHPDKLSDARALT